MNTNGETNLKTLLATMQPVLHDLPYVFCSVDQKTYKKLPFNPLGVFREQEGITIIISQQQAQAIGYPIDALWAYITLTIHSSLSAIGFLAAITGRLAQAGISVNPVSAFYHDHLFVPWENSGRVMAELKELSLDQ